MDETYMAGRRFSGRSTPATPLPPLTSEARVDPEFSVTPEEPVVPLPPIYPIDPEFGVTPEEPTVPLPPDYPIDPDFGVMPDQPVDPDFSVDGGVIIVPGIINPRYATVRFFNAAVGYDALRITVGARVASPNLAFGNLTNYGRVGDGFRTVTIARARAPREILYRRTIPFSAGELITLAVVRTNIGLDLVRISDSPCFNRPYGRACIRTVNLCWDSPALDVFLSDGRLVFSDVRYKEATDFRQARPRDYSFYVAQTPYVPTPRFSDIETIEETPIVAPNYFLPGYGGVTPLSSFYINAKRNGVYTAYILGSWNYSNPDVQVRVMEDFQ